MWGSLAMVDIAAETKSKQPQRPSFPLRHPLEFGRWLLYRGQTRSVKAKKNIAGLFILRAVNSLVSLMLVPLTLAYLDKERFGIWVTLTSVIGWAGFLDIGLGNGLRNKLAESIAREDEQIARIYVSTTYTFIAFIAVAVIILFSLVNPFLSWSTILNTPAAMDAELHVLALVVLIGFCLKLLFGLINTILVAHQRPAAAGAIDALVGVLSLVAVWVSDKDCQWFTVLARGSRLPLRWLSFRWLRTCGSSAIDTGEYRRRSDRFRRGT